MNKIFDVNNLILSQFPNISQTDYNICQAFINKKCSEYYFLHYLTLTNGKVDDAIDFFKLDEKLRTLLLRYVLRFENQIKTDYATELETTTGSGSFWSNSSFYLNSALTRKANGKPSDFNYLRRNITKWIHESGLLSIPGCSNYLALHACSFGSFVDLVKFIDIQYKSGFIFRYTSFLPIQTGDFSTAFYAFIGYLACIRKLRNRCAHGAYVVTSSFDSLLQPHIRLSQQLSPDPNKSFSMLEITINYLFQYSNCKHEFKRKLKNLISQYLNLLSKYNGLHSFSNDPINNLF